MQAQLKIRELVEDTPSLVAFSTARSALQKRGLLFIVEVTLACLLRLLRLLWVVGRPSVEQQSPISICPPEIDH